MKTPTCLRFFRLFLLLSLLLSACQPPALTDAAPTQFPTFPAATKTLQPRPTVTPQPTRIRPTAAQASQPAPSQTTTPISSPVAKRVLIISIDGLRPDAISQAPMKNVLTLMQTSAFSLTAQTIFPSVTLPAHTSMLSGLCPAKHGISWDVYMPEKGFAKGTGLFNIAHAAGLFTAMFVGKEKLRQVAVPESTDVFRFINDSDMVVAQDTIQEFPANFSLMFVHFPSVDLTGHAYGWMSPQYLHAAQTADNAIGLLLKYLDDHSLRQETLIIISSDHGGHAQTHGSNMPEDMTIPWVISGPGVHPGQLTTSIQTTDTAATAAWALGLTRPAEWDGWPVFEAFGQPVQPRPVPFCQ